MRVAAHALEALRERVQEDREALERDLAADHHEVALVVLHLAADDAQELLLQPRQLARDLLQPVVRHFAGARPVERLGAALVMPARDRVEAHDLARQVEAEHLAFTLVVDDEGLEGAGAHDVERAEMLAGRVERLLAIEAPLDLDDLVEQRQVVAADGGRQAQLVEAAARAALLQEPEIQARPFGVRQRDILANHPGIIKGVVHLFPAGSGK